MIKTVLIANRGEIALRVIETCKQRGLKTVAIHSPIDRYAPHCKAADICVELGSNELAKSYLDIAQIIAIAKEHKADAIHPGYGFLSENAEFSQACAQNDIIFIGPSADAIKTMGSKSASKLLLETTKVPLVPGYNGASQDRDELINQAQKVGFPLLIKASAGGGGKGMRIVNDSNAFSDALDAAKREALGAFGDDHVILERYITSAKHIEIQVFRDQLGNAVYLFERDCSMQRRHQKIIEEAPSLRLTPELRRAMGEAAVATAEAINYEGAGTVEFLLTPEDEFFFMEMNTRLQVEHPVTEAITGTDLVSWQLDVANGLALAKTQEALTINGHAIEVRIYAESPHANFLPSTGLIRHLSWPDNVRVDYGVTQGQQISQLYDPMIAKLIVHADTRDDAIEQLKAALDSTHIYGVDSNVPLLRQLIRSKDFSTDRIDTNWLDRNIDAVLEEKPIISSEQILNEYLIQTTQSGAQSNQAFYRSANSVQAQPISYQVANQVVRVEALDLDTRLEDVKTFPMGGATLLTAKGVEALVDFYYPERSITQSGIEQIKPPMSGKVINVLASDQQEVEEGTPLFIIEAMKMEYTVTATRQGMIKLEHDYSGDLVDDETVIMELH